MPPIQHDPAVIRAALTADRALAEGRLAALAAQIAAVIEATAGANSDDEHDPEGATIAFERAQTQALQRAAEHQLAQIDAALARLAEGRYGVCRGCGQPIPTERLQALLTADSCVACSAAEGRGRRA
jgi:DnaK suppressor protein